MESLSDSQKLVEYNDALESFFKKYLSNFIGDNWKLLELFKSMPVENKTKVVNKMSERLLTRLQLDQFYKDIESLKD